MLNLLLDFVSCLKAGEMLVSTAEVLDCVKHLEVIDTLDEEIFRTTLKCNFVKTHRDSRRFERLYKYSQTFLGGWRRNKQCVNLRHYHQNKLNLIPALNKLRFQLMDRRVDL